MKKAIVLINVEKGSEVLVASRLNQIQNINNVYRVKGFFDIIAHVEAETHDQLKETIIIRIRYLSQVRTTLALIVKQTDTPRADQKS